MPPPQSRCGCPAGGICRHILAALIFVKESTPAAPEDAEGGKPRDGPPTSRRRATTPEVLAMDDRAIEMGGQGPDGPREQSAGPGHAGRVRGSGQVMPGCPPGTSIAGGCPAAGPKGWSARAMRSESASTGWRPCWPSRPRVVRGALTRRPRSGRDGGAPRSRDEVLAAVGAVVCEMVVLGLSRLSEPRPSGSGRSPSRPTELTCPGSNGFSRGLASEAELAPARDAQADPESLLAQAAGAEALWHGLCHIRRHTWSAGIRRATSRWARSSRRHGRAWCSPAGMPA